MNKFLLLLLFYYYINDLLKTLAPGGVVVYVDDVTIVSSGVTVHGAMSSADAALAAVSALVEQNGLVISET